MRFTPAVLAPVITAFLVSQSPLTGSGAPVMASSRADMNTGSSTITKTLMAGPYKLVLRIGPTESMYTMAQVKKMHPKRGEVMVSGVMTMSRAGMDGAMANHHLELHVYDGRSNKAITSAMVTITLRDTMGKVLDRVPIATMYGITEGRADFHFGNNVALKAGTYQVATQVNSASATFTVRLGAPTSSAMTM